MVENILLYKKKMMEDCTTLRLIDTLQNIARPVDFRKYDLEPVNSEKEAFFKVIGTAVDFRLEVEDKEDED